MTHTTPPVTVESGSKAEALLDLFLGNRALDSVDVVEGKRRLGSVTRESFFHLLSVAPEAVYGSRSVAKLLAVR